MKNKCTIKSIIKLFFIIIIKNQIHIRYRTFRSKDNITFERKII